MSQISLTASMRSNLLSLQGTSQLMSQTQERLATGKKVNSAIDNASAYYTAQALSNRAGDLSSLLDDMGQAISTIKAANEGIESITSFVEQAKAVATSAFGDTDNASRVAYAGQFNEILNQINSMAKDSGYKGINLLQGDDLTVTFNEARDNTLVVTGVKADATTLGFTDQSWDISTNAQVAAKKALVDAAQTAYDAVKANGKATSEFVKSINAQGKATADLSIDDLVTDGTSYYKVTKAIEEGDAIIETGAGANVAKFTLSKDGKYYAASADADKYGDLLTAKENYDEQVKIASDAMSGTIQEAINDAADAVITLRTYASDFGNNFSIVQNRQSFTENLINVLEEGADKLVLADMNEESANMLALQTRQQLAINSLSLASQASQSVLRLFS